MVLNQGQLTGVSYTNATPTMDYEVELEARRTQGIDFFCGLTFPVKDSFATLVVGGWGGAVVGISSLDGEDAAHNSTTRYHRFKNGQWYRIRLAVTATNLSAWLDGEQVIDAERGCPPPQVNAINVGSDLEDADNVPPLAFGCPAAKTEPLELGQHRVFRRCDEKMTLSLVPDRLRPCPRCG